jgi:uncharacterized protein (DUF2147 family)
VRHLWLLAIGLCGSVALGRAAAAAPATPDGSWLTVDHQAVITIAPCGAGLCGRLAGFALAGTAAVPNDWRGQPECGETIIQMHATADGWRGTVLDPRDGSVWQAALTLSAAGTLRLRGYVLLPMLGETQSWTRYVGNPPIGCRLPANRS